MNATDYTGKLNAARDNYNKSATKLREDYQENLDAVQKTHEHREEKMSGNYEKSVRNKEAEITELTNRNSDAIKKEIAHGQETFNKNLQDHRLSYEDENRRLRNHFIERLDNVRSEYNRNSEEREKSNVEMQKDIKGRYDRAENIRKKEFNDNVEKLVSTNQQDIKILNEENATSQKDFFKRSDAEKQAIIRNNSEDKLRTSEKNKQVVDVLRDTHNRSNESLNEYHNETMENLRKQQSESVRDMREGFENASQNLTSQSDYQTQKMLQDNQTTLNRVRKDHDRELHHLNRKARSALSGGDEGEVAKSETKQVKTDYENRLHKLKQSMIDARTQHNEDKEKADELSKEGMRSQNLAALDQLDKVSKENNEYNRVVIGGIRNQKDNAVAQYSKQYYDQVAKSDSDLVHERSHANKILENQRHEFSRNVAQIAERNMIASEEMRKDHANSTRNIIENNRREKFNELESAKDYSNKRLTDTQESYEQRLGSSEKQIKNLANHYENRINNMAKKSAKELENQKIFEEQARHEEQRAYKRDTEIREKLFQEEMTATKENFGRILDRTKADYDMRMMRMTESYEDQLIQQKHDHDKLISLKLGEAKENYDKLAHATETQISGIRNQYEGRIEKMKLANQQNMEHLTRDLTNKRKNTEA